MKDPILKQLKETVVGWPHRRDLTKQLQPYWAFRDELLVEDSLVLKGERMIIPSCLTPPSYLSFTNPFTVLPKLLLTTPRNYLQSEESLKLVSLNGPQFVAAQYSAFAERWGLHVPSSPHYP